MDLDFTKLDGLLPAVIQDHTSGRVLMVGFMNEEAFRRTIETGFATFYSRSRQKLWMKGESSGHRLAVKEISTDCDRDSVLVRVEEEDAFAQDLLDRIRTQIEADAHAGEFGRYRAMQH